MSDGAEALEFLLCLGGLLWLYPISKLEKRYDCLFTCPQTHSLQLEDTLRLDTDSSITALVTFVSI